jgi:hypothetical protein
MMKKPMTTASAAALLDQRLAYSVDEAANVTGLSRDLLYDAGKGVGRRPRAVITPMPWVSWVAHMRTPLPDMA